MAGEEIILGILMASFIMIIPMAFLVLYGLPEITAKIKLKILGRRMNYGTLVVAGNDRTIKEYTIPFRDVAKIQKGEKAWNIRASCVGSGKYNRPEMVVSDKGSEPLNIFDVKKEGKDPNTYGLQMMKANYIGQKERVDEIKKLRMFLIIALVASAVAAFFAFSLQTQLEPFTKCLANAECLAKFLGGT
jgi:hypothetical protein